MAQKNKILPYIIFGIPAAIAVYMIVKSLGGKKGKDAPEKLSPQENSSLETTSGGTRPSIAKYFPLRKGSKGAKVTELQNALLSFDKNLLPKFGADGDFGSETESAVLKLLNKKTVDSQEDIEKINQLRKSVESAAQTQATNNSRIALADKLISIFNSKRNAEVKTITPTLITKYKITTDGRELVDKSFDPYPSGKSLGLNNSGVSKKSVQRNSIGGLRFYFTVDNVNYYLSVSPFAIEII